MVYLSICLCHLWFLSWVSYSFQNRSILPPYVGLFLGFYSFWYDKLLSFSFWSLLMYRNATDYCVLILCPATLPNLLMSSSSFLVATLRFSMYSIMSSANGDSSTWWENASLQESSHQWVLPRTTAASVFVPAVSQSLPLSLQKALQYQQVGILWPGFHEWGHCFFPWVLAHTHSCGRTSTV